MNLQKAFDLTQGKNFSDSLSVLQKHYETSWGETYSLQELRKAIRGGFGTLVQMKQGTPLWLVGEDGTDFAIQRNGAISLVNEKVMEKNWLGKAIIVQQENQILPDSINTSNDVIIFADERDTWEDDKDDQKIYTKDVLGRLNDLESYKVPSYPVIVIFRERSEQEKKDKIKAHTNGIDIVIGSIENPVEEALHELGHIYFLSRLLTEERNAWQAMSDELRAASKNDLPAIFASVDPWNFKNGEELFAQIYSWRMRGEIIGESYRRILKAQYPAGDYAVDQIFLRVAAAEQWALQEKELDSYLNTVQGLPVNIQVVDSTMIKAHIPLRRPNISHIPSFVKTQLLSKSKTHEWIRFLDGGLKGSIVAVRDGKIDYSCLESMPGKIPIFEERLIGGKKYRIRLLKKADYFPWPQQPLPTANERHNSIVKSVKAMVDKIMRR